MKKKILKGLLFFLLGFIVFFGLRLLYGYMRYDDNGTDHYVNTEQYTSYEFNVRSDDGYTRKNIASTKYKSKESVTMEMKAPQMPSSDQKYEKVGSLSSTTKDFEPTENKIRALVKKYEALIQYEQKTGLPGNRLLNLVMGVPPANFDAMVAEMKSLEKLASIQIDKVDKTNEYKELNAEKVSLEKTITSLTALKSKGGKIDEYLKLEQQILEYEQQLQDLGVQLGDYDEENEFCTIRYTLTEDKNTVTSIPLFQRLMVALEWTIKYYFVFVLIVAFSAFGTFLLLKIAQLLKLIPKPNAGNEKK